MRPGDKAWIALAAGVVAWDVSCLEGEMLSEASHRYAKHHPVLAAVVVFSVASHLINRLPKSVDPIHGIGLVLREIRWTLQHCRPRSTRRACMWARASAR